MVRFALVALFVALPLAAWGAIGSEDPGQMRLAYLDPGSGSFVVQALIAALAGIGVTARLYWTKIKSMLGIATPANDDDLDPDDE